MSAVPSPTTSIAGLLRFVRYGFMPNQLRYCGGDDNRNIFDYAVAGEVDGGLTPLLRKFTGALPYLQLIARANGIADPFDDPVVEAYWLGNDLLAGVEARQLYDDLRERFRTQLTGKTLDLVVGKVPAGAKPHHNFHVFDVHSRAGQLEHSLATMDQCRVSWGRVVRVEGPLLVVERQPLLLTGGKLALGPAETIRVARQFEGRGFADAAAPGDWVSLHWSWVCEVISADQQRRLARETERHLRLANETV
jgi:hypothetical protein